MALGVGVAIDLAVSRALASGTALAAFTDPSFTARSRLARCIDRGGLLLSAFLARFPNQARWYTGAALGGIAAIYCVNAWARTPLRRQQLLVTQGIVSAGLIVTSLGLWVSQTLLPELNRLQSLQKLGVQASYNFSTLELRNWAPFGHQNYVAGYLVLALPLLLGLGLTHLRWRWWWFGCLGLGLIDLYTTSSRGGWLGLLVAGVYLGLVLFRQQGLNRRWLMGGIGIVFVLVFANNRLSSQISNFCKAVPVEIWPID